MLLVDTGHLSVSSKLKCTYIKSAELCHKTFVTTPCYVSGSGSSASLLMCQSTHPGIEDGQQIMAELVITNINFEHEFIHR